MSNDILPFMEGKTVKLIEKLIASLSLYTISLGSPTCLRKKPPSHLPGSLGFPVLLLPKKG
jgi:hypothetical protein